jgi:leader peptidase (prepilin peptidase)/N-methyltransferase
VGAWNIPIVSWFILGGKCRRCGQRFSIRYSLIELLTAAIFAWFFYLFVVEQGAPLGVYFAYLVLAMVLIVASFVDLDCRIIPDKVTAFGGVLAIVFAASFPGLLRIYLGNQSPGIPGVDEVTKFISDYPRLDAVFASLAGMVAGVVLIVVIRFIGTAVFRREAMGLGDAKLMAVIGGFLGWKAIPLVFMFAAVIGTVIGLIYYFKTREHQLPLGPFLALGCVIVLVWGNDLVHWWVVNLMGLEDAPLVVTAFGKS